MVAKQKKKEKQFGNRQQFRVSSKKAQELKYKAKYGRYAGSNISKNQGIKNMSQKSTGSNILKNQGGKNTLRMSAWNNTSKNQTGKNTSQIPSAQNTTGSQPRQGIFGKLLGSKISFRTKNTKTIETTWVKPERSPEEEYLLYLQNRPKWQKFLSWLRDVLKFIVTWVGNGIINIFGFVFKVLFAPVIYISSIDSVLLQIIAYLLLILICLVLFKYLYEKYYSKVPVKKKRKSKRKIVKPEIYVSSESSKPSKFWARVDAIEKYLKEHYFTREFIVVTLIFIFGLIIRKIRGG